MKTEVALTLDELCGLVIKSKELVLPEMISVRWSFNEGVFKFVFDNPIEEAGL